MTQRNETTTAALLAVVREPRVVRGGVGGCGLGTYGQPFADVSGVKPAGRVQRLGRPLRVFEVSLEHVRPLHTDLRGRLGKREKGSKDVCDAVKASRSHNNKDSALVVPHLSLSLGGKVVLLRNIHQFDEVARQRGPHVT